jgi:arylsulfatase A-like enzyme
VPQPNILWICTDQQRYDTLGCYGNEHVSTPAVDELAANGVRFDRCFSQNPVCTPSRASFLTGRYPRTTRCYQNGLDMPDDEVLVTRMLADEGYTCGLAGKLHISSAHPGRSTDAHTERRIDDGYAEFHWSHDTGAHWPTNEYHHWLNQRGVEYDRTPVEGSDHVTTAVPAEHHQTTWCAERTIDFIESNEGRDRPWLYSVNPFDPHPPFDPPREYLEPYLDALDAVPLPNYRSDELEDKPVLDDLRTAQGFQDDWYPEMNDDDHRLVRAAYWAMCDLIDDQVARMLDALEDTGQRTETLVIFMSDHGTMLGDHGVYRKGPYMYEPAVRVPLVVSGPGVREGVDSDALVELSDIAPTLLDAAGVETPDRVQTESLWPLLSGESDPDDHREDVYCEHYDSMGAYEDHTIPHGTMVRTEQYRLVRWHRLDTGELYDLESDPEEQRNRWDDPDYSEVKMQLLERLSDRMFETVDPAPERRAPW